jgi:hypothetical protein
LGDHLVLGADDPHDVFRGPIGFPAQIEKPKFPVEFGGDLPEEEKPGGVQKFLIRELALAFDLV